MVRWAEFDPGTGELPVENIAAVLSDRTRLVAVTAASNLIGTRPALAQIAAVGRMTPGRCSTSTVCISPRMRRSMWPRSAPTSTPARRTSSSGRTAACSPAGCPVLEQLRPDKLLPSTDLVPERFELGTLPYELLAGTTAAVDFLAALGAGRDRRPPGAAAGRDDAGRGARGPAAGGHRGRAGRAARRDRVVSRRRADADPAADLRRPGPGRTPTSTSPSSISMSRPGRSMRSRRPDSSAWVTRAGCGSAWRRTPTTSTMSTGCSTGLAVVLKMSKMSERQPVT